MVTKSPFPQTKLMYTLLHQIEGNTKVGILITDKHSSSGRCDKFWNHRTCNKETTNVLHVVQNLFFGVIVAIHFIAIGLMVNVVTIFFLILVGNIPPVSRIDLAAMQEELSMQPGMRIGL